MRSQVWKQLDGRIIHGNTCHELVTKEYQSSTHESLRLFRFCVAPWEDSRTTPNRTMYGNKDLDGSNILLESQWNSSGIFPRIQYVAAQRKSQKFVVQIGRNIINFHK